MLLIDINYIFTQQLNNITMKTLHLMSRDEFFDQLLDLFCKHLEARDQNQEMKIKEEILGFIDKHKNEIELESHHCNFIAIFLDQYKK